MNCLLCHTPSTLLVPDVFECPQCALVFKNPALHATAEAEFKRYATHQNNGADQGYVDFLNRLAIPLSKLTPSTYSGLDFGCGPGPVLFSILKKFGGVVENFDPLFFPQTELLKKKYPVVTSTEVIEHFKNPATDLEQLINLVETGGLLGIMTLFYHPGIDYHSWWYKNDWTHVIFFQEKTFDYLCKRFHLEILFNDHKSVIIFRKLSIDSPRDTI